MGRPGVCCDPGSRGAGHPVQGHGMVPARGGVMSHQFRLLGSTHCPLCCPWQESHGRSAVAARVAGVLSNTSRSSRQGPGQVGAGGVHMLYCRGLAAGVCVVVRAGYRHTKWQGLRLSAEDQANCRLSSSCGALAISTHSCCCSFSASVSVWQGRLMMGVRMAACRDPVAGASCK